MASVKGPGPRAPDVGRVQAQKGPPLNALETALLQSGIASTPTQARVLARSLVAALKQAGFPPPPQGGAAEQLRNFQKAHGLPVTGKLDDATRAKMADLGILPKDAGQQKPTDGKATPGTAQPGDGKLGAAPTAPKGWTNFTPGPAAARGSASGSAATTTAAPGERTHVVAHEQTRARAELAKDGTPKNLSNLLDGLAQLGFFGGGKGKQRLEGALRGLQSAAGLPTTGKLDAETVKQLIARNVLPEGTEVPLAGRGVAEGTGDPKATQGRGENAPADPKQAGSGAMGQGGSGAQGPLSDGSGRVVNGDPGGEVDDDANAPAGDEDWSDERRGHATLDDDTDDDEGYYEVPPLSRQVKEALESIARNDDESGAVTYSWDVTFYKPGVYGRRQPAEPLWHLVVDHAGAFDPVWQKAKQALSERMREIEPDGAPPSDDDFVLALRRARVR